MAIPSAPWTQEYPQQLIQAVCDHYCGDNGPFKSVFILFDEFGRYLEFASERPHIAGDAALQQLFDWVQNNSDRCFLLGRIHLLGEQNESLRF